MTDTLVDLFRRAASGDTKPAVQALLRIQDKQGRVVPFMLKPAQDHYWDNRTEADIVLKAAQMGFTTAIQAEMFLDALFIPGLEVIYVAQREASAKRLFEVTQRFYRALPAEVLPQVNADSSHMLKFGWDNGAESTIEIGTARSKSFGRGRPVHRALFTEVAFYEGDEENTMAGIVARIPHGGRYVEESTANGQTGKFYEDYQGALKHENSLTPHFYGWWWEPEYAIEDDQPLINLGDYESWLKRTHDLTDAQIRWRRWQRGHYQSEEWFQQEFPESLDQAFMSVGDAVFDPGVIQSHTSGVTDPTHSQLAGAARYWQTRLPNRPYIISVDQASGEQIDDRNAPIDYQVATVWDVNLGTQVFSLRSKISQPRFADHIRRIYNHYNHGLVVVERNLAQYGFFSMLLDAGVHNLYVHSDGKMGYPMNQATKPLLVDNFREILGSPGAITIRSDNLIHELFNFRYLPNKSRSMGAAPGGHDDELITALFAFDPNVREQARVLYQPVDTPRNRPKPRKVSIA